MQIGLVATIFNPTRSRRIAANYERFRNRVLAVSGRPCRVTEVLYGEQRPTIPEAIHLRKPAGSSPLWDKESALNVAAAALPVECDGVAWLDADITFLRDDWIDQAERMLRHVAAGQLFETTAWTDREGGLVDLRPCYVSKWPVYGHPGFAWAARRALFPLYDWHVVGGGDLFMANAWSGLFDRGQTMQYPRAGRRHYLKWAWTAYEKAGGTLGHIKGTVIHHWHGDRRNRQYVSRTQLLRRHRYNPETDVRRLPNGLLDWIPGRKVALQREVRRYFEDRRDDG